MAAAEGMERGWGGWGFPCGEGMRELLSLFLYLLLFLAVNAFRNRKTAEIEEVSAEKNVR